jgi:hypothetical protein
MIVDNLTQILNDDRQTLARLGICVCDIRVLCALNRLIALLEWFAGARAKSYLSTICANLGVCPPRGSRLGQVAQGPHRRRVSSRLNAPTACSTRERDELTESGLNATSESRDLV